MPGPPNRRPWSKRSACRSSRRPKACARAGINERVGQTAPPSTPGILLPGSSRPATLILRGGVELRGSCGGCPVTQERSRLPGWRRLPGRRLADRIADARLRARVMRPRLLALLMRPTAPPTGWGIALAASLLVVQTAVVVYLRQLTGQPFGTVYLLGVLVVSTVWGFGLSTAMSVASALAYTYFRNWPDTPAGPFELGFWLSTGVFLIVALLANSIAAVARTSERFWDLSSDLFVIGGPERAIWVNRACERILGYSQDEMTSQPWIETVAPEDRDYVRSIMDAVPGSTKPTRLEHRTLCKDGSRRWIEWNVVWRAGLFYSVGRDVTDRRREQDQLRRTQTMLEASRDRLAVLAKQQEALRRMATLVARGVAPSDVYAAVAEEMVRCLDIESAGLFRYEADGSLVVMAAYSRPGSQYFAVGESMMLDGDNLASWILQTGRAARHDPIGEAREPIIARVAAMGFRSGVGAPIIVDGRVWGAAIVAPTQEQQLPSGTEERVSDFADLVATAIANAVTRADLIASRARIVAATDNARRRIERDLHDGAQQRLVSLGLSLRMAQESVPPEMDALKGELTAIRSELAGVRRELQEISRGIHPAILSEGGLAPALKTLARRSPVPVSLDVAIEQRLPDSIEVAAYYLVAEALTNVAKHSQASEVSVRAQRENGVLCLLIEDNGVGGAESANGSGLIGLFDRVEALGGQLRIVSPPGSGTMLQATLPIATA
jgi:PAS domain S-box-containing protein